MLQGIPASALDGIGVVGLVLLVGIGFASGRLYTRAQVNELKLAQQRELERMEKAHARELDDIGHDRDEWRAAHRISETARQEERDHNATLLAAVVEPLKGFLEGFRKAAGEVSDS